MKKNLLAHITSVAVVAAMLFSVSVTAFAGEASVDEGNIQDKMMQLKETTKPTTRVNITPTVNPNAKDAKYEDNDYINTATEWGVFDQYSASPLAVLDYTNKGQSRTDGLDIDFYRFTVYPWQGKNADGKVAIRLTNPINSLAQPSANYDIYLYKENIANVSYSWLSDSSAQTNAAYRTIYTPVSSTVQTYIIGICERNWGPTDGNAVYAMTMKNE